MGRKAATSKVIKGIRIDVGDCHATILLNKGESITDRKAAKSILLNARQAILNGATVQPPQIGSMPALPLAAPTQVPVALPPTQPPASHQSSITALPPIVQIPFPPASANASQQHFPFPTSYLMPGNQNSPKP